VALPVFDEPKIDCHVHVVDPARFPYREDTHYRPAGQEIGTTDQLWRVMDVYRVGHALIVGPNSGYGFDNRCLLDALERSEGRCKGVAVVPNDVAERELSALKEAGIVGVTWNISHLGVDYFAGAGAMLDRLRAHDLAVQEQMVEDQLVPLAPMLARSGVRVLIDHCGRPTAAAGLDQPGFRALLDLARTGRAYVKISGLIKFSDERPPHRDAWPYVDALLAAFTPERCMWASDWPYLRAPAHVDYGSLLMDIAMLLPDARTRHQVLWKTPAALFGFAAA
jgi:predicted TIM-barrel fold metal-dependent hydrolase